MLFQRKQQLMTLNPNVVNVQQLDCAQGEKKTFPPDELLNKLAGELPEGVDPAEKEVSVPRTKNSCCFFCYGLYEAQVFQIKLTLDIYIFFNVFITCLKMSSKYICFVFFMSPFMTI